MNKFTSCELWDFVGGVTWLWSVTCLMTLAAELCCGDKFSSGVDVLLEVCVVAKKLSLECHLHSKGVLCRRSILRSYPWRLLCGPRWA